MRSIGHALTATYGCRVRLPMHTAMTPASTTPARQIGADDSWAIRRLAEMLAGISSYARPASERS